MKLYRYFRGLIISVVLTTLVFSVCENVLAISSVFSTFQSTQIHTQISVTESENNTETHLTCNKKTPNSPCSDSEPCHYEIAFTSMQSKKLLDSHSTALTLPIFQFTKDSIADFSFDPSWYSYHGIIYKNTYSNLVGVIKILT